MPRLRATRRPPRLNAQELTSSLLASHRVAFYSSFLTAETPTPHSIRAIIQLKSHKVSFSVDFVVGLIENARAALEDDDDLPIDPNQVPMRPGMFLNFYRAMHLRKHSVDCRLLRSFKEKFGQIEAPLLPTQEFLEQIFQKIRAEAAPEGELVDWFLETPVGRARLAEFSRLKNKTTASLLARKLFGCVLVVTKQLPLKTVGKLAKLTISQLKHALRDFRSGRLSRPYSDHRGEHMKRSAKVTVEIEEHVKAWVAARKTAFTLYDLQAELAQSFPGNRFSRMTLHRLLRDRLNFQFRTAVPYPPARNSENVRHQRFWFAHKVLHLFEKDQLVVSIDECGFSGYHTRRKTWLHPDLMPASDVGFFRNTPNVTLLLAVSEQSVLGYFLLEGSISCFIFGEFMLQLDRHLKETFELLLPPVFIMDNAQAHKGEFLRSLFTTAKLHVIYLPPYSPELNWIEFVFAIIKKRLDKTGLPRGKSSKKI